MQTLSEKLHAGKSKGKTTQQIQWKAKTIHIYKIKLTSFTHKEPNARRNSSERASWSTTEIDERINPAQPTRRSHFLCLLLTKHLFSAARTNMRKKPFSYQQ
jgi:hypothetical protein